MPGSLVPILPTMIFGEEPEDMQFNLFLPWDPLGSNTAEGVWGQTAEKNLGLPTSKHMAYSWTVEDRTWLYKSEED